jgi:hypothetical protein
MPAVNWKCGSQINLPSRFSVAGTGIKVEDALTHQVCYQAFRGIIINVHILKDYIALATVEKPSREPCAESFHFVSPGYQVRMADHNVNVVTLRFSAPISEFPYYKGVQWQERYSTHPPTIMPTQPSCNSPSSDITTA